MCACLHVCEYVYKHVIYDPSSSYLSLHLPFLILLIDWKRKSRCLLSPLCAVLHLSAHVISPLCLSCCRGVIQCFLHLLKKLLYLIWMSLSVWCIQVLGWVLWTMFQSHQQSAFRKQCKITASLHQWRSTRLILARVLQLTLTAVRTLVACMCYLRAWFLFSYLKALYIFS